jgi:NAD+ synthase
VYDLNIDAASVARVTEQFIREQVDRLERDGIVLGISGGIDSAVAASLAVRAVGADQVLGLLLPERDSSPHSSEDGRLLMDQLGAPFEEIDLTPTLEALGIYRKLPIRLLNNQKVKAKAVRATLRLYRQMLGENPFITGLQGTRGRPGQDVLDAGHAYARAKHRARMITLYFRAELENRLVLGGANRTEVLTGSMVKWGDSVADAQPLLPLFKTQVRQLARFLDVPSRIIEKPPTADLLPGVDDETAFGIDYAVLDRVLYGLERGDPREEIADQAGTGLQTVDIVIEMHQRSQHMRELPPAPVPPDMV